MEVVKIKVKKRENVGKNATKQLRKKGLVPGVLYGGDKNIHFYAPEHEFDKIIYTDRVYFIDLDVDGEVYRCIKKDDQFHPVSDKLIHIDFLQIFEDKPVKIYLPVKLVGFAKGVQMGGNLYQMMRYILVKGLPGDIPDHLEVDITNLGLGKSLKIGDLKFDKLTILEPESAVVATIKLTRAAKSKQQEEAKAQ